MKTRIFTFVIYVLLVFIVLFAGCENKTIHAKDIIYGDERTVNLIKIENLNFSKDITDKSVISKFIYMLREVEIRKLSKEEELEILDNGERLKQGKHYMITLFKDKEVVGLVLLLSEEEMILFDPKTVNSNKRTVSYSNVDRNSSAIKNIKALIESKE